MTTHTPITHWLSLPWGDVRAWAEVVVEIQKEDREAAAKR